MAAPTAPLQRDQFSEWVHDALSHLYDASHLQAHPLGQHLVREQMGSAVHRSQSLRRILLEAVHAMRPAAGTPAQSPDWRSYRILELRYIEGLSAADAMARLALGRSQYFREQSRALEAVAGALWDRWQDLNMQETGAASVTTAPQDLLRRSEADRLRTHATWEEIDVASLLQDLKTVVLPLAQARSIDLAFLPLRHVRFVRGDRVMLRQAVLGLLTFALELAPSGRVLLGDYSEGGEAGLRVSAALTGLLESAAPGDAVHSSGLEICGQLMEAMGGRLLLAHGPPSRWEASLAWPVEGTRTLMVVDDNEGLIELFRRYLAGHPWQVVGATSGVEARRLVLEAHPTAIALDVMMPGQDGWELLMSFKSDGRTRSIPVIVCSVLQEVRLAESLGATAYLPKPVTQQALLQALARWSPVLSTPSTGG